MRCIVPEPQASLLSGILLGIDAGMPDSVQEDDFYAAGGGNYGPFTGAHDVKLSDDFPMGLASGFIVSVTGKVNKRLKDDGSVSISSTLPTVRLSDRSNDKAVFGVLVRKANLPEGHRHGVREGERFGIVNALGA